MFIVNDNYPPHRLIKWGFIVVCFLVVLSVLVGSSSPDEVCSDSDFYFHDWAVLYLSNFLLKWYQCNKQSLFSFHPFYNLCWVC